MLDAFLPIWNGFIVHPLIDGLKFLAAATGSGGMAIVLFTIAIRLVMLPLSIYQMRSQKAMTAIQPLIKEIQRKHGNDRERVTAETMRIYKENGVNPASGCLPLVIQMPIFIGLYSALITLSSHDSGDPQFQEPFMWLPNLSEPDPFYVLPVLTGVSQFIQTRMMTLPSSDPQQQMMNRMMTFMPLMFMAFTFQLPSGLVLYWVVSNLFSIGQQYFSTGWGSLFPLIPSREGASDSPTKTALQPGDAGSSQSDGSKSPKSGKGNAKSGGKRKRGGKR